MTAVREAAAILRPVTADDARLLFDWLNRPDSLVRKERTAGPVAWADHRAWLGRCLADEDCHLAIILDDNRRPVGQVRLQPRAGTHHLDIYLEPAARDAGLARRALAAALDRSGVVRATARIHADNAASRRLFADCGFSQSRQEGNTIVYCLVPTGDCHG